MSRSSPQAWRTRCLGRIFPLDPKGGIGDARTLRRSVKLRAEAVVVSIVLALAVLAPVSATGESALGRVSANARVGIDNKNPLRGEDVPAIAADPADPRHIVMVNDNFLAAQCEFRVTFDGGAHWDSGNFRAPDGFPTPPCPTLSSGGYPRMNQSLVFGSDQNVYTVFDSPKGPQQVYGAPSFGKGQGDSVLVARSSDGGRTFNTAVVAIEAPVGTPFPFYIRSTLGVEAGPGGDRLFVAAWGVTVTSGGPADGAGSRRLVTTVSKDAGATWSAPVDASAPGEQIREPSAPVVGPDGAVYVAWRNRDTGAAPSNVVVGKSTDGGATWARNLAGAVTGLGQGVGGGMPELGVDRSTGALYLVYQETLPYGDQDIYFQRSTDGATTWSTPLRVNDDLTANKVRQHVPHIAVAPNGRIDVVWLDHRLAYPTAITPAPRGGADVYYANSSDGGKTFSRNRRITDRTINLDMGLIGRVGSYSWFGPVVAPLGNDAVFFAWADPRSGNADTDTQDLYTATLQLNASGATPVQTLPKTGPIDLSVALSRMSYPGGNERYGTMATATSKVVIVNENDVAGAMAAAVLARANFGPLLLSSNAHLSKSVKDEIARMRPSAVYLVGSPAQLSDQIIKDLDAIGVNNNVMRLAGSTPEQTAVAVAGALDVRSPDAKAQAAPAVQSAVIVNPATKDGPAAVALASANRFPILFVSSDAVPRATSEALQALGVTKTLVTGNAKSISDGVLGQLPRARRLADQAAIVSESKAGGTPTNVVYVSDQTKSMDCVLVGVSAARIGGMLVTASGSSADTARKAADSLGVTATVDRVVVAGSSSSTTIPWALIVLFLALALVGLALLVATRALRKRRGARVPATAGT